MTTQLEEAEGFRSMHQGRGKTLVLPNAWDVASARMFEKSGFKAVATSSAGVLVSLGYVDDDESGFEDYLRTIKRMGDLLTVPLSVDILGGMAASLSDLENVVMKIIEAGAVGLNIEDFDQHSQQLVDAETQVERLKAIKEKGASMGIPLVINARTDALRHGSGNEQEKFREAATRSRLYRDAGADCVYPMGLVEKKQIADFVGLMDHFPVNVMLRDKLPPLRELEELDVRRLSFGPYASYSIMGALKRISAEVLEKGDFSSLLNGAITYAELNDLVKD